MKTALQQLIDKLYLYPSQKVVLDIIIGNATVLLETEKEQIQKAYDAGSESDCYTINGEIYYTQIFKPSLFQN